MNEPHTSENKQSETADFVNLGGDQIEAGIRRYAPEQQDDLRWYYRYSMVDRKLSFAAMASELGMDTSTVSRVLRGKYEASGVMVPPPAKMLSRIRIMREQERERTRKASKGRIMTPTVDEIWEVCRKCWRDRLIGMVFGTTHIGKTEALKWFRDENNHGATVYVDLQGLGGVQDLYREFARALGISPNTPINKLKPRVMSAIDHTNLILVDEFHYITHAYQKGGAARMVSEIKSIKDRTGCAMVICMTEVGREEFEKGADQKLMAQLWRRGTIKLQLPNALRVADVRAICAAYGLHLPPVERGETWKRLRAENSDQEHLAVLEDIAYGQGVQSLVTSLQDGNLLARSKNRELQWCDIVRAQEIYAAQSNPKTV